MEPTKEMVYIVDDDPRVREALSSLLRASGKGVRIFRSGQEFLDCRREDSSACLILDLKMPGLGGLEVQRSISAKTSIPVIFITGRGDIPSTVTAMKGGASDFLTKPVDEAALLASVERALRQDRANFVHRRGKLSRFRDCATRSGSTSTCRASTCSRPPSCCRKAASSSRGSGSTGRRSPTKTRASSTTKRASERRC